MTTDFCYNQTTGTFSLNGKQVCRGYYGTETVIAEEIELNTKSNTDCWTLTIANNGTTVRIFSISRSEYDTLINHVRAWRVEHDRVWFMATFKNLDGHVRNWGTKNNTYGKMFEEIVGAQGIVDVMDATRGNLCISYFIRHPDNDIFNELEKPEVLQTIAWDSENNKYVNTFTITPGNNVTHPIRITPIEMPATIKIDDGTPLILTTFMNDGDIKSVKYITKHDEYIRVFRCKTHNRFAALFVTECLKESSKNSEEKQRFEDELEYARRDLFSQDELVQFKSTIEQARHALNNDLLNKLNGKYVEFPSKMYQFCNIKNTINSYQGNNSKENYTQLCERIWNNLCNCFDSKSICAVEEFIRVYGKMIVA